MLKMLFSEDFLNSTFPECTTNDQTPVPSAQNSDDQP